MKNNISFYPHDTNSHENWKFKTLRKKYGWAGEGRFWALHNMIGNADGCLLDICHEDKKMSIAADLELIEKEFDEFIEFLTVKCKLLISENGVYTTERAQETLQSVNSKRGYQREWKKSKVQKSSIDLGNSSIENTFSNIETKKSNIENEQRKESKEKKVNEEKLLLQQNVKKSDSLTNDITTFQPHQFVSENALLPIDQLATLFRQRYAPIYNANCTGISPEKGEALFKLFLYDVKTKFTEKSLYEFKTYFGNWMKLNKFKSIEELEKTRTKDPTQQQQQQTLTDYEQQRQKELQRQLQRRNGTN